jgi:predicted lysophospholipase L1 biosynthesis ABC-type transport system permease subunit
MDGRTGDYITNWIYVTPGVVRALGMTVLRGRALAESDMSTAAPVALVNESFVRRYYPGREVVGEHLRSGGKIYEVVGVLRDIPAQSGWGDYGPLAPIPTMYVPAAQLADGIVPLIHTWFTPRWVVRTDGAQGGVIAGMQRALAATDPLLAMTGFRSIDQVRATSLANQRLRAQLLGGLAALAVVLTFVGLYGLIAHTVAERKHEIGIRMALGATAGQLVRQTAGAGVTLAIVGVLLGAGLATAAVPLLQSLLWGVRLLDPLTYGAAAAGLLLVAAVASIVPARRVTRFDPSRMLRSE